MNLTFRCAVPGDFEAFYKTCFPHDQDRVDLRRIIEYEWDVFFDNPTTLSMVVEDRDQPADRRLVGFTQMVFVSDAFVRYVRSGAPPYANQHASHRLPDGTWPLLSEKEVREQNRKGGLNALTTRWGWAHLGPDEDGERAIREYLVRNFATFYSGYKYKEHLIGANGKAPYEHLINAGFKLINDYAGCFSGHSSDAVPRRPYLLGVTRDEALREEGTFVSRLFAYSPPRFHFKDIERELHFYALLGLSDRQIAELLLIEPDAIKKRWASSFKRVERVDQTLLPTTKDKKRGTEKRSILLHYLRDHPEELRPVIATHRKTGRYPTT